MNKRQRRYSFDVDQSADEQMEELTQGVEQVPGIARTFWYVIGWSYKKNRNVILGPFYSEEEAERKGQDMPWCKIEPSHTKDRARFTSEWKAKQFEKVKDIDTALERVKHKI